MKTCPTCRASYPDAVKFCSKDGTPLPTTGASNPPTPKPVVPKARTIVEDRLVGRVIEGKYQLDERIGEGGMGVVYRGRHTGLGTAIAVKILRAELTIDEKTVLRFEREARISSQFAHPGIVKVTDFGRIEGSTSRFLVMDFVEGETLTARLERGPLPVSEATRILAQVADALAHAHGKGVVHRDLKPDNVIVGPDGSAKILDFGIARHVLQGEGPDAVTNPEMSLTDAGGLIGTPQYMAPEQCQGRPVDARTDLYALGVIAFECLTGKLPFDAPTTMGIVLGHLKTPPPSPRAARAEVPAALDRLVLDLLAKEQDARPKDAAEVQRRLLGAAGASETVPRREAEGGGGRRVAGVALVLVGVLGAGGAIVYHLTSESTPEPTAPSAPAAPVEPDSPVKTAEPKPAEAPPEAPKPAAAKPAGAAVENLLAIADGAWPTFLGDASRSARSHESALRKPKQKWRTRLRAAEGSSPIVGGGLVYVGGYNGIVTALDASTGQKRWEYTVGSEVRTTGALSAKAVYYLAADGRVLSIDAQKGTLRWEQKLSGEGWGSPALADGVLYVQTSRRLAAITTATGVVRWQVPLNDGGTTTAPLVLDDLVFAGGADGRVHAYGIADGAELRASPPLGDAVTGIAFVDGLIAATAGTQVAVYDRDSLAVKWQSPLPDWSSGVSGAPGMVFARVSAGAVVAVDLASGRRKWTHAAWSGLGPPQVVDDVAYLCGGALEAVRLADGKSAWSKDLGQPAMSTAAQANGVVYVTDVLGAVVALEDAP